MFDKYFSPSSNLLTLSYDNYPLVRMRRNRQQVFMRELIAETQLSVDDLILPIFIRDDSLPAEISKLPYIKRYNLSELLPFIEKVVTAGIKAIMLFPCVDERYRTEDAAYCYDPEQTIFKAIRLIKSSFPQLGIIGDIALDTYTSHCHDGLVIDGYVDNDKTIVVLQRQALAYAEAGADAISPSEMMDGRIVALRCALDKAGHYNTIIISYAAKYASCLYQGFRQALRPKAPGHVLQNDKRSYHMDFRNSKEAMREMQLDIQEGADALIIKPAMWYLDIISQAAREKLSPIFAYHVSGEYAMLRLAAEAEIYSFEAALMESITALKRAGSRAIITYAALEVAKILGRQEII